MSEDVADRMARLVTVVERSRAEGPPRKRRPVGEELQAVIEVAEQFPPSARRGMGYPVLKRLLGAQE